MEEEYLGEFEEMLYVASFKELSQLLKLIEGLEPAFIISSYW